jgi:hypothetical protein
MVEELIAELSIIKLLIVLFEIIWIILRKLQKMQNRYCEVYQTSLYYFVYKYQWFIISINRFIWGSKSFGDELKTEINKPGFYED